MIIVGAGGHAKEVFDILSSEDKARLSFYDDISLSLPETIFQRPVVRNPEDLFKHLLEDNRFILGIGSPIHRDHLFHFFLRVNATPVTPIARTALISSNDVHIGDGVNVMNNVFISNSVTVGKGSLVNTGAHLHHDIQIGDFCEIAPAALLLGKVRMGSHVFVGAGAIVLPGLTIGNNVVIGAGAIVTKSIPDNQTVRGNPAR